MLFKDYTLVKGICFDSWRRVGSLIQAVKVYSMREVDELIFLDINATIAARPPDFALIDDFADDCLIPLTVGGGVRNVEDIKTLLRCGADKVSINTAAVLNPGIIQEAAKKFGSQCIVVSIDAKKNIYGRYEVFIYSGTKASGKDVVVFAKDAQDLGAGEILLTSIDNDGTMKGYDLDLVRKVSEAVSIPVIASGGAGGFENMLDAIVNGKASALAAASVFNFTQVTPRDIKEYLSEHGIRVRL